MASQGKPESSPLGIYQLHGKHKKLRSCEEIKFILWDEILGSNSNQERSKIHAFILKFNVSVILFPL